MHTHLGRATFLTMIPLSTPESKKGREREGERAPDYSPLLFHPLLVTGDSATFLSLIYISTHPSPHPTFIEMGIHFSLMQHLVFLKVMIVSV